MKFADISRSLFQALTPVPSRKPRRRSLAFDSLEGKLLLSTYYVATTGSNSANGSATAPWATIQQAANEVKAGDTVYVAPGTYNVTGRPYTLRYHKYQWDVSCARFKFISKIPGAQTHDDRGPMWLVE